MEEEKKDMEVILIYDNARPHVSGFGGWFCRQLPGIKITIAPYCPE